MITVLGATGNTGNRVATSLLAGRGPATSTTLPHRGLSAVAP